MTVQAPTSYPTQDVLTRVVNRDDVDKDDWAGIVERQQHIYKYVRPVVCSMSWYSNPFTTTSTSYKTVLHIPDTSDLWTGDDFDAELTWSVRVRASYPDANSGDVLVTVDDGTTIRQNTFNVTSASDAWSAVASLAMDKMITSGVAIWVDIRVNTSGTLTFSGLHIYTAEQGSIE